LPLLRCVKCSNVQDTVLLDAVCERCSSALVLVAGPQGDVSRETLENSPAGVWRYRDLLPSVPAGSIVSLGEGGTPLLPAARLGRELGLSGLLLKDESRNPTGSFIDRGATVLVSLARWRGVKECSCVTTGNLGASLAAYCAKAGIAAKIRIQSSTDRGKLYQMIAYGAEIEVPQRHRSPAPRGRDALSITAANPYILEGEKTTCFEVVQELGWETPDAVFVPVGTGGHLSMFWRAILQLKSAGLINPSDCRLFGVQLAGSTPAGTPRTAAGARESGLPFTELEDSEPFFVKEAASAIKDSRGVGLMTTAGETIAATGLLARTEGIFAEPASASVVASLKDAIAQGLIHRDDVIVCVITGTGLKDTRAMSKFMRDARRVSVREDYAAPRMQIGGTKIRLLQLLSTKSRYGYELWLELNRGERITTASVYQHLAELERSALIRRAGIVTKGGRERILYETTKDGADFLRVAGKFERAKTLTQA